MQRIKLEDLVGRGSVIKIEDPADPDHRNFFMCRGREAGHYVMNQIGQDFLIEPFAVKHLPAYRKLCHDPFLAEQPGYNLGNEANSGYVEVLRHLNQFFWMLREATELGLQVSLYDPHECFRQETFGLRAYHDFSEESFFDEADYEIKGNRVGIVAYTKFARLDEKFGLVDTGRVDNNRLAEAIKSLRKQGIELREFGRRQALLGSLNDVPDPTYIFPAVIARMSGETASFLFASVKEAYDHVQELNGKLTEKK